jgi:hypothetical protein
VQQEALEHHPELKIHVSQAPQDTFNDSEEELVILFSTPEIPCGEFAESWLKVRMRCRGEEDLLNSSSFRYSVVVPYQ